MVEVKKIMRRNVITVDSSANLSMVAKILINNNIGSVVIMENGKPVNIITDTDVVRAVAEDKKPEKIAVSSLGKKKLITAAPSDSMLDIAKKMVKTGIKRIPVVDGGKLVGIVTEKEILASAPELIEIMSEKLKFRIEKVAETGAKISGLCESCGNYSDELSHDNGRWFCEDCAE